eukprot:1924912-Amphidinium_carterae.3
MPHSRLQAKKNGSLLSLCQAELLSMLWYHIHQHNHGLEHHGHQCKLPSNSGPDLTSEGE